MIGTAEWRRSASRSGAISFWWIDLQQHEVRVLFYQLAQSSRKPVAALMHASVGVRRLSATFSMSWTADRGRSIRIFLALTSNPRAVR